jgi:hypothetical protein
VRSSLSASLLLALLIVRPVQAETRTGVDFFGFPVFSYTTTDGFGYGANAMIVNRGPNGSGDEPYLAEIMAQYFSTTLGYQNHRLELDFPRMLGTPFRWNMRVGYEAWTAAPYFGEGNFLPRLYADLTPLDYYLFAYRSFRGRTNVRVLVSDPVELFAAYSFRLVHVDAYPGSLLALERPTGIEGGVMSEVGLGALVDTRDRESSPRHGVFSEGSVRAAGPLVGSAWTWVGLDLTDRRWIPLDKEKRLILANRVILDGRSGQVPFFEESAIAGTVPVSIGGQSTLRGLPTGRYRGDAAALLDTELRWTVLTVHPLGFQVDATLVPFLDTGRVFLVAEESDPWWHLHTTLGLGGRLELKETFVARADFGFGREEYVPRGLSPSQTTLPNVQRGWVVNVTMMMGQPF